MSPELITEIASRDTTRTFLFGSKDLEAWNKEHVFNGRCVKDSEWYVVVHRNHDPRRPDFRVLSRWSWGKCTPHAEDVPAPSANAA